VDHVALSTMIGHLVILITQLAGLAFQWKMAERRHQWQREEFEHLNRSVVRHGSRNGGHDAGS
jgi:hypothetical protein